MRDLGTVAGDGGGTGGDVQAEGVSRPRRAGAVRPLLSRNRGLTPPRSPTLKQLRVAPDFTEGQITDLGLAAGLEAEGKSEDHWARPAPV